MERLPKVKKRSDYPDSGRSGPGKWVSGRFLPLVLPQERTAMIFRVTTFLGEWKAQVPARGGPGWGWEEGPGEILSSCASLSCQTIASLQNHWPRKCKNISRTGVLNSWWDKKFWLLDFLVCYLLVLLSHPLVPVASVALVEMIFE